ncbi:hypothetical protein EKI60_01860 [Candidatus Saccharibacteria bacterium]|nr:MAG: hypothetical protein EKI60_01860 [Candidatus Saccharibacteria bacterium]
MRKVKKIIAHIPIIGYLLRIALGILLLPRHLVSLRHAVDRNEKAIKSLQDGLLRANRQIIELEEQLEELKKQR